MGKLKRKIGFIAAGIAATAAARMVYKALTKYHLKGKVVLITGGSRGLGLVLAKELATRGAYLALCARSEDQLENARQELASMGAEVMTIQADVTNNDEVQSMISGVITRFGRIDVLINNAGITQVGPYDLMKMEDYDEAMKTHFWGPLQVIHAVIPHFLIRNEGKIVNITSIGGKMAIPHMLPYTASKFALVGLSEGLHTELKKQNIQVTTVIPNLMRTGSERNMAIKGNYEAEYSLVRRAGASRLISQKPEVAARAIIAALEYGQAEAVLSATGKMLVILQGLLPGWVSGSLEIVSRLLPDSSESDSESKKGYEIESMLKNGSLAK